MKGREGLLQTRTPASKGPYMIMMIYRQRAPYRYAGVPKDKSPCRQGAPTENGPYRQSDPTDKGSLHTRGSYR